MKEERTSATQQSPGKKEGERLCLGGLQGTAAAPTPPLPPSRVTWKQDTGHGGRSVHTLAPGSQLCPSLESRQTWMGWGPVWTGMPLVLSLRHVCPCGVGRRPSECWA